jgi:hypothetical protein
MPRPAVPAPPTVIGYGVAPQTERQPVLKPPAPPPPPPPFGYKDLLHHLLHQQQLNAATTLVPGCVVNLQMMF